MSEEDYAAASQEEDLARAVRRAFPHIAFERGVLQESGGDYRVLVLDGRYAFRFPRRPHYVGLQREIAVLRALQARCATPTPNYRFVAPDFAFAGYRFIAGEALTPARFAELDPKARARVIHQAAEMLTTLHRLEPAAISPLHEWARAWTPAQYAARALDEGVPLIASFSSNLAARAEDFLAAYSQQAPVSLVVVHGDLVPEHLLLDLSAQKLAGVIDFGDVSLGDPAQDFAGLWAYGEAAVGQAVSAYGAAGEGAGLLARSQKAWARYRIDRLWQALKWQDAEEVRAYAKGLEPLLDDL